jgi:hypothetical protein
MVANGTLNNEYERGRAKIDAFVASPCTSASCPIIGATAEMPIELVEVENAKKEKVKVAKRGASTLPWSAELIKTSEPAPKLRLERVGITIVVPPCKGNTLLEGGGEFLFEGTLEPSFINGLGNGLNPSSLGFGQLAGRLVDTSLPETEKELVLESTGNPVKLAGESDFELITAG